MMSCSPKQLCATPERHPVLGRCRVYFQIASAVMDHHPKFEESRFLGDKRTQLVYDLQSWDDDDVINEFVGLGVALCFSPDELPEARNRGYTLATPGKKRMLRAPRA
jgi:hypothetical protein